MAARAVQGVAVMFVALSLSFFLLKQAKGDPYSAYVESGISPAVIENMRAERGYNRPLAEQYVRYLALSAQGNLGVSTSFSEPVSTVIAGTLPHTIWLMLAALMTSVLGGMAIGAWQGAHVGSRRERVVNAAMLLGFSIPEFWLATVFMLVFGFALGWFPLSGMTTIGGAGTGVFSYALDLAYHALLPWLALSVFGIAVFARYQRGAMRDVVNEPYVRTARAKGLTESAVLRRHAFRVAVLPVLTVVGLWLPALLGGAVFVEQVFSWPGMGRLLVGAIGGRDYDLVQGCVIVGSLVTVVGSLCADVLREFADPRLRA